MNPITKKINYFKLQCDLKNIEYFMTDTNLFETDLLYVEESDILFEDSFVRKLVLDKKKLFSILFNNIWTIYRAFIVENEYYYCLRVEYRNRYTFDIVPTSLNLLKEHSEKMEAKLSDPNFGTQIIIHKDSPGIEVVKKPSRIKSEKDLENLKRIIKMLENK